MPMDALSTEVASVIMPPRSTLRPELVKVRVRIRLRVRCRVRVRAGPHLKLRASARPGGSLPFGPVSTTKSAASCASKASLLTAPVKLVLIPAAYGWLRQGCGLWERQGIADRCSVGDAARDTSVLST